MRDEIFESFPYGIIKIDSANKIQRMNYYAKQLTHALDEESLAMLLDLRPRNGITTWSVANHQVALNVELFMVGGDSHRLLLLGLEPNFSSALPPEFERALEDLTTDPEEIVLRIVNMVSEAIPFERFDLVRVNPQLRKYNYAYSIGLEIAGSLHAPYSLIKKTGLGWVLEKEAPQLNSSLRPESFAFLEDPMLYQTGFRSALRVPIIFSHEVIGAILLGSTKPCQFEIEDAYLINQIARHISQAFFHSGIIQERSYYSLATSAFLHSVAENLQADHILDFLKDYCTQLQTSAELESIHFYLLDQTQEKQKLLLSTGKELSLSKEWQPLDKKIAQMVKGKSIVCYNLAHTPTPTESSEELLNQGLTSILLAPIEHGEKVVGALVAAAMDEKAFSPYLSGLFKVATEQLSGIVARLQTAQPQADHLPESASHFQPTQTSQPTHLSEASPSDKSTPYSQVPESTMPTPSSESAPPSKEDFAPSSKEDLPSPTKEGLAPSSKKDLAPKSQKLITPQSQKLTKEAPHQTARPIGFARIIGSSTIMEETIQQAVRAAQYDFPILITGETGTGKEMLAKAIHQSSPVSQGPFIVVNSAAIPDNLLESELFGYQEGAFSGGVKGGKPGKILLANKGTLFLDEIGELSPELQAKLLRVIQEQEVEPLGAIKPIPVKVRILSATHRDLNQMVKEGKFREDLLYRLNSIELKLPPLRDRGEDIIQLAEHMLKSLAQSHGTPVKTLSSGAKELLLKYSWPGNIRQLQNIINRLYVFVEDSVIQVKDLPPELQMFQKDNGLSEKANSEKEEMVRLLEEFGGNKTALAQYLGITRTGLWKKLKRLGLQ